MAVSKPKSAGQTAAADAMSIGHLRKHSGLPGPRGNLELLNRFAAGCEPRIVAECLAVIRPDTANCPDEFVGMCGVVGFSLLNGADEEVLLGHLAKYAVHSSWRIREAVAISLQEIPVVGLEARLRLTTRLESGDPLIHRAIIAGLCEPKNLKETGCLGGVFDQLARSTRLIDHDRKLTEGEEALRKALGYGWSVAIVAAPEPGRRAFEKLILSSSRHVRWVIQENLKKNRLIRMAPEWVADCRKRFAGAARPETGKR